MPADYASAAAALSLPVGPSASERSDAASPFSDGGGDDDDDHHHHYSGSDPLLSSSGGAVRAPTMAEQRVPPPLPLPPWARQQQQQGAAPHRHHAGSRASRLSRAESTLRHSRLGGGGGGAAGSGISGLISQSLASAHWLARRAVQLFLSLSPVYRALAVLAALVLLALGVLALVYAHALFGALAPLSAGWRALPYGLGYALIFAAICATSFPPLVGYSTAVTLAGFVYGFPGGWPVAAAGSVLGSLAAFAASRTVLLHWVEGLVGKDHRFQALAQVLRREGIGMLALVRFCPLPFSISNGFLATVRSISPAKFALATLMASPKLLVHVFIGSRLALLAEVGDKMSTRDRVINFGSMVLGGLVGVGVGWLIYRRTMRRAAEIAAEEAAALDAEEGAGSIVLDGSSSDGHSEGVVASAAGAGAGGGYEDDGLMMDPDDVAALMDDDDISLWETDALDEAGGAHAYEDPFEEGGLGAAEGNASGKKPNGAKQ